MTKPRDRDAVFVDSTGRRRRIVRMAGIAAGCVLAAYLATITFGLVTGSEAPLTPWPDAGPSHAVAKQEHRPRVTPSSSPSLTKRPTVGTSPNGLAPTAAHSAPATTRAATTTPRPGSGKGRGHGLTKSPAHTRKP